METDYDDNCCCGKAINWRNRNGLLAWLGPSVLFRDIIKDQSCHRNPFLEKCVESSKAQRVGETATSCQS